MGAALVFFPSSLQQLNAALTMFASKEPKIDEMKMAEPRLAPSLYFSNSLLLMQRTLFSAIHVWGA